jgi:hypothetical protein
MNQSSHQEIGDFGTSLILTNLRRSSTSELLTCVFRYPMQRSRTSQSRAVTSHSRISASASRPSAQSIPHFGKPKPTRDVHPSEIHELRAATLRIENEIKLQQTKFNRLKERILIKTDAIDRALQQKVTDQSATAHQSTIAQLQQTIARAENTVQRLQEELEEAEMDDRTALYQEADEEVRASYLELERVQTATQDAKAEAEALEARLKGVDLMASNGHLNDLREQIAHFKTLNSALRKKWTAYQEKMHRMNVETKITANRNANLKTDVTLPIADAEYNEEVDRLNQLADVLDQQNAEYQQNVDRLIDIIDGQRRMIVKHLMGREDASHLEEEEGQREIPPENEEEEEPPGQ